MKIYSILFFTAPGGTIVEDTDGDLPFCTKVCVFTCEPQIEKLKSFYAVCDDFILSYET